MYTAVAYRFQTCFKRIICKIKYQILFETKMTLIVSERIQLFMLILCEDNHKKITLVCGRIFTL